MGAEMTETVARITHLDGKLPNLALMRLSAWHKARGDAVRFSRSPTRELDEPSYDVVYGSAIFTKSVAQVDRLRQEFPEAVVGGTGTLSRATTEEIAPTDFDGLDYSLYPDFKPSIGFTQRGCRLRCSFCVVPTKEGRPTSVRTIAQIWRGPGHPKKLHLLDNDFFGNPEWPDRIAEIRDGRFRVCINQGINVRVINDAAADALASIEYRDDSFSKRRLYTAWDNIGDERVFFRGVDRLEQHGVPPTHLMAYMLVGYDPAETWDAIWHRFNRMVSRGIMPYVMLYDPARSDLRAFARWSNLGLYRRVAWNDYRVSFKTARQRDPFTAEMFEASK
jgi:hypothetical protein